MKVVFASRNKNKIREFNKIVNDCGLDMEVLSLDDIGYFEETEENGTTFEENSLIKARVPASMGYIGIADDSGISVDALGGEPGVYSARFAGEPCDDEKNNDKLIYMLKDTPDDKRTARYVCVISCVLPYSEEAAITTRGECVGTILHERKGAGGFGYDPLFYCDEFKKTYAELSADEKNSISHRGKAVRGFCTEFKRKFGNG